MGKAFKSMKRHLACITLLILVSCSPKLKSTILNPQPALQNDELVVVLRINDDQNIEGVLVGEVKATDGGFSSNCTYYENIINLKQLARQNGANVIKVTQHKTPDKWSSCHRLRAKIYKVDKPKTYETEIVWTADRKLTWDDFKGVPDRKAFPNTLAVTNSGFGFETGFNAFKTGNLFVQATFNNYGSWVIPKGRTDYVLRHEQIHFDLTEIYSRKLRKAFDEAKIKPHEGARAKKIFDSIFEELNKRQKKYDSETKYGEKNATQEYWESVVEIELIKYDLYKSN